MPLKIAVIVGSLRKVYRSLPAALKNAIDVGSRPYGHSVWDGKPAAVASVSPGALGGFGANHHLRQSGSGGYFDEAGELADEGTRKVMQRFIDSYAAWVEKILA